MNMQPLNRVQRSFSRSFATYDGAADEQARVAQYLVQSLASVDAPRTFARGLELGCGTGHLTRALTEAFEIDRLWLNDLMPEAQATAGLAGAQFLHGDAEKITWPQQPDLIASASMIQWMPRPQDLMRHAAERLAPGGWLAISGFGPQQYCELSQLGSTARAPGLRSAEDLARDVDDLLEVVTKGEALHRPYFDKPRDVLRHLRETGVNGRAKRVWTKSTLARFSDEYSEQFGNAQGVPLTYHPVWVIARKV